MDKTIESIEVNTEIVKVTLHRVFDRPGIAAEIFGALGQHGLNVEAISTNALGHNRADIAFAILSSDLDYILKVLQLIKDKFRAKTIIVDKDRAIITIYGSNLATTPGIASSIFSKLSDLGINIEMISASLSVLSIVIKKDKAKEVADAIKLEFLVK